MINKILTITADGSWQVLGQTEKFPKNTVSVFMQARGNNEMYYRYPGDADANFMTIRSGMGRTLQGDFDQGEIAVQAASSVVIEVECSTVGVVI